MFQRQAKISFLCRPEDKGVIPEPQPAKAVLPDWFRRIPAIDKAHLSAADNALTVKRCMPFFDAMATGWILPLCATVRLEIKDGGNTVDAGWEFDRTMVSNHSPHQVAGNPLEPRPPMKFHNHWTIKTPPGWSCLFVAPLNRPHQVVQILAGVVDTDTYASQINLPFIATGEDGVHVLEKGMPLAQVIPFRRTDTALQADIRAETADDAATRTRIFRNTLSQEGWYRKVARAER